MNRQAAVVAIVAVIAVALVAVVVATHNTSRNGNHATTLPGVAPNTTPNIGASPEPCAPSDGSTADNSAPDRRSTTTTATTPQGTTPDGSAPTANNAQGTPAVPRSGAFVGAPCTPNNGTNETNNGLGTAGGGTTSTRPGGTPGSGSTHGAQSDR